MPMTTQTVKCWGHFLHVQSRVEVQVRRGLHISMTTDACEGNTDVMVTVPARPMDRPL